MSHLLAELDNNPSIFLCHSQYIDYRHNGIGSHSCGPELDPKYALDEHEIDFRVRIKPVFVNNVDPFVELYKF